jgi:very-short-patch-repair endonuclease
MSNPKNLSSSDFHLPYHPQLISRAKELRKNPTPAERKLWQSYLKTFPFRVLRQRPIAHFIVDFYCAALKLVIEVDGDGHFTEEGQEYDQERTEVLTGYRLKVVRFTNDQVMDQFEVVCGQIGGEIPLNPP